MTNDHSETGSGQDIPALREVEREVLESSSDDLGARESQSLSRGLSKSELKFEAEKREHSRNESLKDNFNVLAISAMYLMLAILAIFAISWCFHLVSPKTWHWLDGNQVSTMQNLLTGGAVIGLGIDYIKKRLQ